MNVRPTSTGPASKCDAGALRRAGAEPAPEAAKDNRPDAEPADRVELSQAARELSATRRPESASELTPERFQQIMTRLAQGFYHRPEVHDRILERLTADLENDPSGA